MKITKSVLKQLIKEELSSLAEAPQEPEPTAVSKPAKKQMPTEEEFRSELKQMGLNFPDANIKHGEYTTTAEIIDPKANVRITYNYSIGDEGAYPQFYVTHATNKEKVAAVLQLLRQVLD